MNSQDDCPICYRKYGLQEDGDFLCKDSKDNSDYADACRHYICVDCCRVLSKQNTVLCPLCREDWTQWIHSHYPVEEEEEEEEESEEDDDSDSDYEYESDSDDE